MTRDRQPNTGRKRFCAARLPQWIRLCLIPLIVQLNAAGENALAAAAVALSALCGAAGEWLAHRRPDARTGSRLAPIARMLTQAALILCLLPRYKWTFLLVLLFVLREILLALPRRYALLKGVQAGTVRWIDRVESLLFDASAAALLLFDELPQAAANGLLLACALSIAASCLPHLRLIASFFAHKANPGRSGHHIAHLALNLVLLGAWAALIALCIHNRERLTLDALVERTPSNSLLAALVMLALFAVKSLTVVIYGSLLYAASGMLFPLPTALLINLLGTVVMISLPYLIGTRAGSERVRRLLQAHPRVEMLREFQTQNSLFFAFITRLIGFFPSDLVGVAMGASGIRYRSYLLGSLMGLLPSMLTFSVMGVHARDVRSPEFLLSMGLQAALTLLSTVFYLVYRKKHRSRTAENEDKNR